ncbi:MAG: DedA family protein [Sulfurospirillaceae bacterium]|jgi:membrane protein DedA with SNARE-associated domain|nr:DedA family protein [Sulfurospirillaceae bacterium]MCK9546510.1 DedA family protein [Sulfurospirillaceae bacterium]MDY0238928.1 DedA family protein [Campylobacterales bacterium]
MEGMLDTLTTHGHIIGYVALFFYSLGGGMVAIIAAGVLSYSGQMNLSLSIIIAAIANTLGDTLLFYMSRYNKDAIMPYIIKHRRKVALSHLLMKKHGDKIIFFQKFVYGIKTLIPLTIGLTKYSFTKFNILNAISASIWAVLLGFASFYAGDSLMKIWNYITANPWTMPLIIGTLLGLIWFYFHKATRKRF